MSSFDAIKKGFFSFMPATLNLIRPGSLPAEWQRAKVQFCQTESGICSISYKMKQDEK